LASDNTVGFFDLAIAARSMKAAVEAWRLSAANRTVTIDFLHRTRGMAIVRPAQEVGQRLCTGQARRFAGGSAY
jgi:hypothetical protein